MKDCCINCGADLNNNEEIKDDHCDKCNYEVATFEDEEYDDYMEWFS